MKTEQWTFSFFFLFEIQTKSTSSILSVTSHFVSKNTYLHMNSGNVYLTNKIIVHEALVLWL